MAAFKVRIRRFKTRFKAEVTNRIVFNGGKQYRVATHRTGRVLIVALKCPAGGERYLDPCGVRAKQILGKEKNR